MDEIVVIDGEIELENTLDGEVELEAITDLDPEVVLSTGGAVYPHYEGPYTVTPSGSVQTLDTSDKVMDDDVTVQAVQAGSATTPATIITANPSISVSSGGLITAQVSKTQQITPTVQEGYVSAGTPGNVGVAGSNTQQLTVQSAQTIHPASTDQSIASGKYLTGAQTFKAVTVTGLTADKVLQGTTVEIGDSDDSDRIMKVVGTASGGITPTGTKNITANGTNIDVYNYQYADVAVPNSYSASDEGKVVSNGALVSQTSDTVTTNDTYDTTLINSLTVNVSGGGNIGGLAEMVDVNTQDYQFAYMLTKMKKGETAGGKVTYTSAFPNTSTKILETGLTTLHGVLFVDPAISIGATGDTGVNKVIFIFVNTSDTISAIGFQSNNVNKVYGQSMGTVQTATPLQGAVTISGGDVYVTGRYNKNASYQLLKVNTQYEWLAW